jgi:uncharacterized iron-regulated membrane protein
MMIEAKMSFLTQFVRRPQNLWVRRAIFQIHLWTGIAMGLYVVAISISGSALFFRNKINESVSGRRVVAGSGPLLTKDQLMQAARRAYPDYTPRTVWQGARPGQEVEIMMTRGEKRKSRVFDPYTGRDLGAAVPYTLQALAFLLDLHVNLLAGPTGRLVNGVAAILLTLLALTGAVIWWPGITSWRRSLKVNVRANWKRVNWDLHSAIGFWSFAFFFMWSFTGVYLVFPAHFDALIDRFAPLEYYKLTSLGTEAPVVVTNAGPALPMVRVADAAPDKPRKRRRPQIHYSNGDMVVRTMFGMHFGNFGGMPIRIAWAAIGLIPPLLFITGALMWWNRVLSREARRLRRRRQTVPSGAISI